LLDADDVTIWKDVPGIMNADPKLYKNTEIINKLSYKEAVELSHCGAKVIHPKTIKPLQNKGIPLYVRSFLYPESRGSVIRELDERLQLPPIYIDKDKQLLLTLSPRDFSFIAEEKLSHIFATLAKYRLRLNLMQNSAITFSFCIDYNPAILENFIQELQGEYEVLYNKDVRLLTIRHYTEEIINTLTHNKNVLVEQRSRLTARFVISNQKNID
jgi:aspartate kinase